MLTTQEDLMSVPYDQAEQSAYQPVPGTRPAGWVVGMTAFAVLMMVMIGIFHAVEGLVALFTNEIYVVGTLYVFAFDLTAWGWIHLLLGIVLIVAGVGVRTGQLWARSVGIAFVVLSMIANFLFVPYYPVWSLLIIALDFFVIWALCVYSEDAAKA
jgi:hypothetical protein